MRGSPPRRAGVPPPGSRPRDAAKSVTEDEMLTAARLLAMQARLIAKPGGAAAVAAFLFHASELPAAMAPVAVLSGGNIDPQLVARILAED